MTGLDGIGQDTAQFMPRFFIRDLCVALHRQYPKMWMVGEVFNRDPAHTAFFMGGRTGWDGVDTELDSVFDFPLWQTSLDVFTGKKPVSALRDMLKSAILSLMMLSDMGPKKVGELCGPRVPRRIHDKSKVPGVELISEFFVQNSCAHLQ